MLDSDRVYGLASTARQEKERKNLQISKEAKNIYKEHHGPCRRFYGIYQTNEQISKLKPRTRYLSKVGGYKINLPE